jgi:2-octaprenyl-6-methoxyphenol hydroxylase
LLGNVTTPRSPDAAAEVAYERFTDAGPLALLPLPEPRRRALVWCDTAGRCEQRLALDRGELEAVLQARFGTALGPLRVEGPLAVAPLARRLRRRLEAPGEVWIGNAAQTLHPVAGQGLNLGLRDAYELAAALGDAARREAPLQTALPQYRRRRRADRSITVALTDLMAGSFTWPLARPLQSPLLAALDLLAPLRRPLAAQLMFGWR